MNTIRKSIFIGLVVLFLLGTFSIVVSASIELSNSSDGIWSDISIRENSETSFIDYQVLIEFIRTYFPSTTLPDNNSIGTSNYIVKNLVMIIIGAMIGALITYFFSLRLLEQRLERENAVKFLTEHYLPLLGTLEWTAYVWHIWGSDDTYKEKVGISEEETKQFLLQDMSKLSQILESTIRSGSNILFYRIDEEIYQTAMALNYLIKDCLYKNSQNQNISDDDIIEAINKVTPSIEKLHKELSARGPELIKEYQKIMKDKNPILED
jgi:cell fate (sporulation/competence/biofilm development) regulator YmcA (YheA/YmcA/DUF963 family)